MFQLTSSWSILGELSKISKIRLVFVLAWLERGDVLFENNHIWMLFTMLKDPVIFCL